MSASEEIPVGTGADDDSLPSDGSNNCAKRIKLVRAAKKYMNLLV